MIAKWFATGALALSVLACRGAAQSPAELLEKGIYTQETVGDLDHAVEIYRQIVSASPAARTYVAQAQYRLAQCLLQKGAKLEAAREFKKVIEVYPEEKDLVEKARESLLPLAKYLEADYHDPALGLSFSSPEWPVRDVSRLDDGALDFFGPGVQVGLTPHDPMKFPRVDLPSIFACRSTTPSLEALYEKYKERRCKGCRILSTGEVNGRRVLRVVSQPFPLPLIDNAPAVGYGVLMRGENTELIIEALLPVQEFDRNPSPKIIERILESVRMR